MKNLDLSKGQSEALQQILIWIKKQSSSYLTLGGYAGTGKTTLIAVLRKLLRKIDPKLKVAFVSYTGKASRVLDTMLEIYEAKYQKDNVSTIHSLIYEAVDNDKGVVIYWKLKDRLDYDLIIVDEASMVSRKIWIDMLSFSKPILCVGDHGQLPPIEGKFNLMEDPMIRLEEIHRQAEGNPIIKLSMLVRKNGKIEIGNYGKGVMKLDKSSYESQMKVDEVLNMISSGWMLLCGYNNTRVKLNQAVRDRRLYIDISPQSGDKVICLMNNWEKGIYNGMTGRIRRLSPVYDEQGDGSLIAYQAEIDMEDGRPYMGKISANQFDSKKTLKDEVMKYKGVDLFDFGYALTVHKAQGSQADKVLVIEERFKQMDNHQYARWLYTAVTRAREELIVVG